MDYIRYIQEKIGLAIILSALVFLLGFNYLTKEVEEELSVYELELMRVSLLEGEGNYALTLSTLEQEEEDSYALKIAEEKRLAEEERIKEEKRIAEEKRIIEEKKKLAQAQQEKKEFRLKSVSRGVPSQVRSQKSFTARATHYTSGCSGCSGITASGVDVRDSVTYDGMCIVAVDRNKIPLWTKLKVDGVTCIALDTGGAIKGNRIDILVGSKEEAYSKGIKNVEVEILGK